MGLLIRLARKAVMPYWGWLGLLLCLVAMVSSAWRFAESGNPLLLLITLVAGVFAYRLTRGVR